MFPDLSNYNHIITDRNDVQKYKNRPQVIMNPMQYTRVLCPPLSLVGFKLQM